MINLTKGLTEIIYFTGTEKATLTAPNFLFTFTNRETLEVVIVPITNTSTTARYDKASIVVDSFFSTSTTGFYTYSIMEYTGSYPSSPTYGVVVETGYMYLNPATAFTPTEYAEQSNEFKTYNGA
jgi:hypothetical protein